MAIRHVRMAMPEPLVPMQVAVRSHRHFVMYVVVMSIVVAVRMLMLERYVLVLMAVRLHQVKHHAGQHQRSTDYEQPAS